MAEGTLMGIKPRMPECYLPSLDQDHFAARTGCSHPLPGHQGNTMKTASNSKKQKTSQASAEGRQGNPQEGLESYLAPPPSSKGRSIGIDCHPDTFTWAVLTGTTLHDACLLETHADRPLQALLDWAAVHGTPDDTFLMEAGSNSFEICRRLHALGRHAYVLESTHVGRHAALHCDNDKIAAMRIAKVYLIGKAPCVWQPDPVTAGRRELLHAHQSAVSDHTAATNALKGYLNQFAVRPGKQGMDSPAFATWLGRQRTWTPLQKALLDDHLLQIKTQKTRRDTLRRLIALQISGEPLMLRLMKILGIGLINAFALLATIGDIHRFARPAQLVAYLGLSPGQRQSGHGKDIRVGVRKRGRGDLRHLLIQGAHAVLRMGRDSTLGKWGWKLFARKGQRNIAVVAVARKMVVQVWHHLMGHAPSAAESEKSVEVKLRKLTVLLGKKLRAELALPGTLEECLTHFLQKLQPLPSDGTMPLQKRHGG
jgi:transposase